jgi:4-hydroxy-tetrahydrodipicolinate reductase
MPAIAIVHLGFGPIGRAVYELLRSKSEFISQAIVDLDAERIRGEVADRPNSARVVRSLDELRPGSADVVIQCTGSRLTAVARQIDQALDMGANVISTCEELSFPWRFNRDLALEIDRKAQSRGKVVLATGVNPGFAMDTLPLIVSLVTPNVSAVRVRRVVDASRRRGPLQQKIGIGISRGAFDAAAEAGAIGHVGLAESLTMLATGLRLEVPEITSDLQPVLATGDVNLASGLVKAGSVLGIRQTATGSANGEVVVELKLEMYAGAIDEGDWIDLEGDSPIQVTVSGLHGDAATAAITARLVPSLVGLTPGLRTMLDVLNLAPPGTRR